MATEYCPNDECQSTRILYLNEESKSDGYGKNSWTVEHYRCEKCGAEFDVTYETTRKLEITKTPIVH